MAIAALTPGGVNAASGRTAVFGGKGREKKKLWRCFVLLLFLY